MSDSRAAGTERVDRPLRALIVEDSALDADLIVRELERYGYRVDWQQVDTAEALRAALEAAWDVVLVDYSMPRLTNLEALALVRERSPDQSLIIVSGSIGEEVAVQLLQSGVDDFLLKDRLTRLGAAVDRALGGAGERKARREAENELARSAASLALAQRLAKLGSFEADATTGESEWSAEMYRLLGRDPALEPPTIAALEAFLHPEDRVAFTKVLERVRESSGPLELEVRSSPALGSIRSLLARVELNRVEGRADRMRGTLLDITEAKRTEAALYESEERLRLALSAAQQGLYDLDLETGVAVVTAEYASMLGYDPATFEETNARWIERLHPEDRPGVAAVFSDYVAGRIPEYRVEFRQRTADGHWKWILSLGKIVERDAAGRPLRMLGTHTDITPLKEAEADRARLASAIEQAAEAVMITDAEGAIQYVNPAFSVITGYPYDEAIGRNPRILRSGEQDEALYRSLWATLAAGRIWSGRMVNRRKDGSHYVDESVISPVRDAAGRIVSFVAVKRDITSQLRELDEKKKLQSLLFQSQKLESVGRLAGGVAHDFNNMLSVILGCAEMALANPAAEPIRGDLEEILRAGQRSAELTRQLLAFARQQAIQPRVLDLNENLSGMLKLLVRLIGEEIELAFEPGPGLRKVRIDPSQVDQLLANLVVNARDAVGGPGRIRLATANVTLDSAQVEARPELAPGDYVAVTIEDDGSGMDEETLSHIFEPFFTTKEIGQGTGLGLATVYGIVSQNGGFIDARSAPGRGTIFTILLPALDITCEVATPPGAEPAPPRGSETVLLVEDEAAMLTMVRKMLEAAGYRVLAANTPVEAVRLSAEHPGTIDLLLTDVVMPGMSGQDLARRLAAKRPDLAILFMSGYTADRIVPQEDQEDRILLLEKPFSARSLAEMVREAIGSRQRTG